MSIAIRFISLLLFTACFSEGVNAKARDSAASLLLPVDTAAIAEYRKNSRSIHNNPEKAYRVTAALLTQYHNDFVQYYTKRDKLYTPLADHVVLDLYLNWVKTLPPPALEQMAKGANLQFAFTILFMSSAGSLETKAGKPISVVRPPPFIVNTELMTESGKAVPPPVATPVKVDRALELPKPANEKLVLTIQQRLDNTENTQSYFFIVAGFLVVVAVGGIAMGAIGFNKSKRRRLQNGERS